MVKKQLIIICCIKPINESLKKIARKMNEPIEKFPMNLMNYGNTSAASIPILLDELIEANILSLNSNQKVVLTGYGGGLAWNLLIQL